MEAVTFVECFGWVHDGGGSTGVVLCNPFGHEALWGHRGVRKLAEHLAACGITALRFDYPGTGDALGSEDDPDTFARWISGIHSAVTFLKTRSGVERVVLCGIRLGALLAAEVAGKLDGISGLILLAPTLSGRDFMRELTLTQRRWRNTAVEHLSPAPAPDGTIETFGFRLSATTAATLADKHLASALLPTVKEVLVLDASVPGKLQEIIERYRLSGATVECRRFEEYAWLINENGNGKIPQSTFDCLSTWINTRIGNSGTAGRHLRLMRHYGQQEAVLRTGDFEETPVIFGDGRLFGIYCRPAENSSNRIDTDLALHAALLVNTATNHHIGDSRIWVVLARRLARQGIASLRMDVGALGDSAHAVASSPLTVLYMPQSCRDASDGVDWLVMHGHQKPHCIGVCSGAYLAFHAALENRHVAGLVLINLPHYFAADESAIGTGRRVEPASVYFASLRVREKWRRLLLGQLNPFPVLRVLIRRQIDRWRAKIHRAVGDVIGKQSASGKVREAMRRLHRRGVALHMIYGEFDRGLEGSQTHFGRSLSWLQQFPHFDVTIERDIDHALFLYPARERVMQIVEAFFEAQHGPHTAIGSLDEAAMAKAKANAVLNAAPSSDPERVSIDAQS